MKNMTLVLSVLCLLCILPLAIAEDIQCETEVICTEGEEPYDTGNLDSNSCPIVVCEPTGTVAPTAIGSGAPTVTQCQSNDDCPAGECANGMCMQGAAGQPEQKQPAGVGGGQAKVAKCFIDADCPEGKVCFDNECTRYTTPKIALVDDSGQPQEVGGGQVPFTKCESDEECPTGKTCIDGDCTLVATPGAAAEKTVVSVMDPSIEEAKDVLIETGSGKVVIKMGGARTSDCVEYMKDCGKGDKASCEKYDTNCEDKESIAAETTETIEVKNDKMYMNKKEVKVMPDTASAKAIEVLGVKLGFEIELKDTGKPVYEISGEKDVKVLGLFKAEMKVTGDVDGETGEVSNIKRPWWNSISTSVAPEPAQV